MFVYDLEVVDDVFAVVVVEVVVFLMCCDVDVVRVGVDFDGVLARWSCIYDANAIAYALAVVVAVSVVVALVGDMCVDWC